MRSSLIPVFSRLRTTSLCCLLLLLCFSGNALAELVNDFYDVTLPVADESRAVRNAAMDDGLAEMLVRQSGDGNILQKVVPPGGAPYVKQYRYEPLSPPDPNNPDAKQIRMQYNSTLVMDFLRKNKIPIWGDHRLPAVIWLAVRDGTNQYVLKADDISVIKTLINKLLRQRGVPAIWPAYDAKDQSIVKFADIWAGFGGPLTQASARYSEGPVLAGNLAWNGSNWTSDWTLIDKHFSQQISLRGADYGQVLSGAINQLSDDLGKQYAVLESVSSSEDKRMLMEIDNVNTLSSFVRVKKYISSLQAVQSVQMKRIDGDKVELSLSLRSTVDEFVNLLAGSSHIKPVKDTSISVEANTAGSAGTAPAGQNLPGQSQPGQNQAAVVTSKLYRYRLVD